MIVLLLVLGPKAFLEHVQELSTGFFLAWLVVSGLMLGLIWRFGRELFSPVQARYMPRARKVSFRFRQPGYAEQFHAFLQDPSKWTHPLEGP